MAGRPNILVFLTDDHAQWAIGCYGNREIHSPSMDHLARTGAVMADAYTPSPVCSPARASFWTGTYPSYHGVHDHLNHREHPGIADLPTLGSLLQAAGYRTGLVGKWHCHPACHAERKPGFDRWFTQGKGTCARVIDQYFWDQDEWIHKYGQQAPFLTEQAIDFLREEDERPFFLVVGYTDTHSPFATLPERLVAPYREATFDDIPDEEFQACHGWAETVSKSNDREAFAQYYASVTHIDEQVGRVVDELASQGRTEDTLTVYTGDHGHNTGNHGVMCKGNATIPQNFLNESIAIPCILSWPGTIAEGQRHDTPVNHCDMYETLLDVAGVDRPAELPQPGQSFWPVLTGASLPWRDVKICEYGNARMIANRALKLIRRYPGENGHYSDQLFDLQQDPRETQNVINDPTYAESVAALDKQLQLWFAANERHETSGLNLDAQPLHNPNEPWRSTRATD